jgi:hypothetical protein
VVPSDLARLIEAGPRALEAAQTALDYLVGQAPDKLGPRRERLIHEIADVHLHPPRPNNARIAENRRLRPTQTNRRSAGRNRRRLVL